MDLHAANEMLLALRRKRQTDQAPRQPETADEQRPLVAPAELPDHLGWGSAVVTEIMRRSQREQERREQADIPLIIPIAPEEIAENTEENAEPTPRATAVRVYPAIGLALIDQGAAAVGRVWLLLRALDVTGRGWVDHQRVREVLTDKESGLRICGNRQLRKLLAEGDGRFWERDRERVWLRSLVRVSFDLGIRHLSECAVELPVERLVGTIGEVRAQLYATLHSSRDGTPICRDTITAVSGLSRRTQLSYEKVAGVESRANYAIGAVATREVEEETVWARGGSFVFADHHGKHGRAGRTCMAWQMGNSYNGPHERLHTSQRRRINKKLADLRLERDAGNGRTTVYARRYFDDGAKAARAHGHGDGEVYWSSSHTRFWYCL